jgi:hypothetical protein
MTCELEDHDPGDELFNVLDAPLDSVTGGEGESRGLLKLHNHCPVVHNHAHVLGQSLQLLQSISVRVQIVCVQKRRARLACSWIYRVGIKHAHNIKV